MQEGRSIKTDARNESVPVDRSRVGLARRRPFAGDECGTGGTSGGGEQRWGDGAGEEATSE